MSNVTRRLAILTLAVSASAGSAAAQTCPAEPDLRHWNQGGQQSACPCFVAGERAGAVFTAPPEHYPIEILKVRIGWGSVLGGNPAQLEQSINIYPAGLPNPGAPQFQVVGPQLADGFINEFDLSLIPGNKVINGGSFTVALEFLNGQSIFDPSVISTPPCQAGRNVVFAVPGGWLDACNLGVSGNWVFDVVYRIANCENLNRDVSTVSLGSGGSQEFTLSAGAGTAGWIYWMLGSVTGTAPGIPFGPGITLPLNFDPYFALTLKNPFLGIFGSYLGVLDLQGTAHASFSLPPGSDPDLAGLVLNHAYIASSTFGTVDFASNAKSVTLVL